MKVSILIWNWIKAHKIAVLVNGFIWVGFVCYMIFLSGPLFARFEVIPGEANLVQMQLPAETNNMKYNLDRLITATGALEIQGWAFINGYNADYDHVFVVLESTKATYIFDASTVYDWLVTGQYGGPNLNLDWSGFTTTIPLRKVKNGTYTIGVCVNRDGIMALQYSDKILTKSNTEVKLIQ